MTGLKVLVLGGTGPAGICLLRELISRKHATVAYARSPSKIPEDLKSSPYLEIIKGEMDDTNALSTAVSQCYVVLSLLGPNIQELDRKMSHSLYADMYENSVFPLMRQHGVRRILAMGTLSIKRPEDSWSILRLVVVTLVRVVAGPGYWNMQSIAQVFDNHAEGLDWTVFRIAAIPGDSDEESWKKDREDGELYTGWVGAPGWTFSTKRSALARWLADAAEGKADEWIGKMPALSRKG